MIFDYAQNGMQKKLALLFNAFWINRAGMSGGDRRLLEIFKRIGSRFELTVYTSEDGRRIADPYLPGARFIVNSISGSLYSAYVQRALWATRLIQRDSYDVVYASSDFFPDVLPCHAARKRNAHTKWFQCIFHLYPPWFTRPGNLLRNLAGTIAQQFSLLHIKKADGIITLNSQVRDQLNKLGFGNRIIVNPCGVDPAYCFPSKSGKQAHQCCFLGRLAPSKGIFDLVEIWRSVAADIPDAKLKIVGGGTDELMAQLQNRIIAKGLSSSIEVCGFLPEKEAFDVVRSSGVFLFPSHEEGFGMVIAEAMACGVPVIAWNLPVYRDVFPKALLLATPGDIEGFSSRLIGLIKTPALAEELARKGSDIVDRYNWDTIAEKEFELIR